MNLVNIDAILIPEYRVRKEFDPNVIVDIQLSILSKGLFHAPVLRDDGVTLVAGETRLKAIRDLYFEGKQFTFNGETVPMGMVPYVKLADLDPLDLEEAELEENLRRKNLTWQEEAQATARLADLRVNQAAAAGQPLPGVTDLTRDLDLKPGSVSDVSRRLVVARHLDDPEVASAPSTKEAYKVIQKKARSRQNAERAAIVGASHTSSVHQIYNTDALGWLEQCPSESFDVILTDPPYGMGADEFGDKGGHTDGVHGYQDDEEHWLSIMDVLIPESFRITKPQAHMYMFCDIDNFFKLRLWMENAGWKVFRTPMFWYKPNNYTAPWPDKGPQRKYETILFASKGDKLVQKMAGDIIPCNSDENLGHMAQKPVMLFENLLGRSCVAGDRVLDPFCGTGPIFPAAHGMKLIATGIEKDASAYGIAVKRLEELK